MILEIDEFLLCKSELRKNIFTRQVVSIICPKFELSSGVMLESAITIKSHSED